MRRQAHPCEQLENKFCIVCVRLASFPGLPRGPGNEASVRQTDVRKYSHVLRVSKYRKRHTVYAQDSYVDRSHLPTMVALFEY